MIAKLSLVPFVTRLTAGVCMKVRFNSKVTRRFSFLVVSHLDFASSRLSRLKKNVWDKGIVPEVGYKSFPVPLFFQPP